MEHTLRAMRITIPPMGVLMTASEANRQRVLTLLLAEREQMFASVWGVTDGLADGVSRISMGWPSALSQNYPAIATGTVLTQTPSSRRPDPILPSRCT
jgi:hypothetical protein